MIFDYSVDFGWLYIDEFGLSLVYLGLFSTIFSLFWMVLDGVQYGASEWRTVYRHVLGPRMAHRFPLEIQGKLMKMFATKFLSKWYMCLWHCNLNHDKEKLAEPEMSDGFKEKQWHWTIIPDSTVFVNSKIRKNVSFIFGSTAKLFLLSSQSLTAFSCKSTANPRVSSSNPRVTEKAMAMLSWLMVEPPARFKYVTHWASSHFYDKKLKLERCLKFATGHIHQYHQWEYQISEGRGIKSVTLHRLGPRHRPKLG